MDFKVLITDNALLDLKEIIQFVANDDPVTAERLGSKLLRSAMSLTSLPQRYAYHDEIRQIRKMPVASYLVFYICDESAATVNILHFWHGARLWPEFGQ